MVKPIIEKRKEKTHLPKDLWCRMSPIPTPSVPAELSILSSALSHKHTLLGDVYILSHSTNKSSSIMCLNFGTKFPFSSTAKKTESTCKQLLNKKGVQRWQCLIWPAERTHQARTAAAARRPPPGDRTRRGRTSAAARRRLWTRPWPPRSSPWRWRCRSRRRRGPPVPSSLPSPSPPHHPYPPSPSPSSPPPPPLQPRHSAPSTPTTPTPGSSRGGRTELGAGHRCGRWARRRLGAGAARRPAWPRLGGKTGRRNRGGERETEELLPNRSIKWMGQGGQWTIGRLLFGWQGVGMVGWPWRTGVGHVGWRACESWLSLAAHEKGGGILCSFINFLSPIVRDLLHYCG